MLAYFSHKRVSGGPRLGGEGGGGNEHTKKERTPRLALSSSFSLFSAFTDTPCFVSQGTSKFSFG